MNSMILFVVAFLVLLLVCVTSIVIDSPSESEFELERRQKQGEEQAKILLRRRHHMGDMLSLQRVLISLLLVVVVVLLVVQAGWVFGLLFALAVALQYGSAARLPFIHSVAQRQFEKYEASILAFIERYPLIAKLLRTITTPLPDTKLNSREELVHLVTQSGVVLSHDEKLLIRHSLMFSSQIVRDSMTPRSVIDSVPKGELLNPLVLDQLHKTGHSRLPVTDGDIDHIVGILHLRDVLTVDSSKKHTARVETAMEPKVYYIHEDQTLDHALAAFIRTHHHLFVVVNEYRETVGLLTLEDVIEALLGKEILDEFDRHDDLRAVAARNPRKNNHSAHGSDI